VLTGREQPERMFGARTQSSLLEMLGAKPQLGRLLLPEKDKSGKPDVAVLSELSGSPGPGVPKCERDNFCVCKFFVTY